MFQKQESFTISEFLNKTRKEQPLERKVHFFLQNYLEEVKAANPKRKKKYQSLLLKVASISLSVLVTATPVFAQTNQHSIPTEVDSLLKTIQVICLGLVAGVASICLMLAGGMRMVGLGEKAKTWSVEILKGTLQVISAPVVIWLIITIVKGLLSPLPGFQNF